MHGPETGIIPLRDEIASKARQIQFHGPALVPSDTAAVLDWGLDIPFTSLDKAPLAITMNSEWGALSTKIPLSDCPEVKVATHP